MERMTPTDHMTALFETDRSPMNIGGLLLFDVPKADHPAFRERMLAYLRRRVPTTVLAQRKVPAPEFYDSDTWFGLKASAVDTQITAPTFDKDLTDQELRAYVIQRGMGALDLTRAPFELDVLTQLEGDRCGVYLKVHHGLMDGVGFQLLLQHALADDAPQGAYPLRDEDEAVPSPAEWKAMADARFEAEADERAAGAARKAEAEPRLGAFLADPANARLEGPPMPFGDDHTFHRDYRMVEFDFADFRATSKALGVSINDLFLAVSSGALRAYLSARGHLPTAPMVSHSVRSTRRDEHGYYGNQVLSIYPELATDEADPVERLARIRRSMNVEKQRSLIEEAFLDLVDYPFGARDRREACANPELILGVLGPANVVLSNVPGADKPLTFAGYELRANYPVPIVGPGRFLNITSRRNAGHLHMGVMADSSKVEALDDFVAALHAAMAELKEVAARVPA